MTQSQRVTIFGLVVLGAFACSSEVPIGEGVGQNRGALGAAGQPPKADGTCDVRITLCGGACRDLDSDKANCGTCANACTGTKTCNSGACTAPLPPPPDAGPPDAAPDAPTATCSQGQDFCGGACIDVLFDGNNCGSCGVKCTAGKKCVRAICM